MEIEITLSQLQRLLRSIAVQSGGTLYRSLMKCQPVLEQSLLNNVFRKPHSDTVKIESKAELQNLIARGVGHQPQAPRPGEEYNEEYLELKRKLGEHYPHKFMEYGFWMGTEVEMGGGNSIVMKADPIIHRGFDYMSHHEKNRSVLKRAFLDAWQDIIFTIRDNIAEEAQTL